jgi:hypothetical protein
VTQTKAPTAQCFAKALGGFVDFYPFFDFFLQFSLAISR